ncbi:19324_t:CDS:2 [Dentiscutata erythropus]|uniref:19324_t:CDS:1 n=1 Tax=Dentiscutata erythropus TaxID=1348616 RepID=A0A9N9H6A2_9GLOM|nr:19324_t:CDS:2 [Dentiscutata erythropus]
MKEAEKLEKQRRREEQKLERQRKKEEREAEKQKEKQFQQVNKLKHDKLEMTREMIVDIENSLMEGVLGSLIRDSLEPKKMTINTFQYNVTGIIKFRRRVTAEWNDELGAFVPIPEIIQEEVYIFHYLDIETFVQFIENDSLHTHIRNLQKIFHNKKLVLLIKGFDGYYRKKKTQQNRTFTNAVRIGIDPGTENDIQFKKKPTMNKGTDLETIEEEFIWLQLIAKVMIVHAKDTEETAEIIGTLSTDIATIPYKNRNGELNFWVENQIRAGVDHSDTWCRMLQEIQHVTEPVAKGILNKHSTIKSLYDAYNGCSTQEEAENLLTEVEIPNNGLGQRNRYVNRALSKRIYEIFMGNNADVIIS